MQTAKPDAAAGSQVATTKGRRPHTRKVAKPLRQPASDTSTFEEECPFDEFTPEEVDEFNACMDEMEEREHKLKRSST